MVTFTLIAVALTIAAVSAIVIPLVRRTPAAPQPALWAAFGAAGILVFGAAALYATWSNWSWRAPAEADTPRGMVSSLARRLERNPDDLDGWLMLGRSYTVLEQYELALRAYERADRLAGGKSAEALVGMGEALVLTDDSELGGRAAKLFERAIRLNPKSGKAQFYGAAAALQRGDLPLARKRFGALLALNPPANVRPLIEQQIAAIDEKLGVAGHDGAGQSAPGKEAGPEQSGAGAAAAGSSQVAGPTETPPVRVKVTLAAALRSRAPPNAPLFVLVRDPRQSGPPLAVKRLNSHFPQTVELTTADSMLPGHTFTRGQLVEVVARISRSGNPIGTSGDLFGMAAHRVGDHGVVDIQIDHLMP